MKRSVQSVLILILLLILAGCSKKEKFIDADKVSGNTILAKANGTLQAATIEDFDKPYYKLSELEEFVAQEIETYNRKAGKDTIKIDTVMKRENQAVMLLTYAGMEHYATFNKVTAAYFTGGVGNISLELPATLVSAANGSLSSTQEILRDSAYKILVLNEPYDIIVEGKVKYYSDNAKLLDKSKVGGASDGLTVVVFK